MGIAMYVVNAIPVVTMIQTSYNCQLIIATAHHYFKAGMTYHLEGHEQEENQSDLYW